MEKVFKDREYEATKEEERFEELLKANSFEIKGCREFVGKTEYLIEKDGVECTYNVHRLGSSTDRGDTVFNVFLEFFSLKKQLKEKGL